MPESTLILPKTRGGLGLPNFATYYKAAQLAQLTKYHATTEIPLWVTIESIECDPISISNLLWLQPSDRKHITNPVTKHSLSLWDRLKTNHNLQSTHNPLQSFLRNPAFYPAWEFPNSFRAWSRSGLSRLFNLVSSSSILSFPELCESYHLPHSELFRYLQIKNFYTPYITNGTILNQLSQFERICIKNPHSRGLISSLYSQLLNNPDVDTPNYVRKWETDLGRTLNQSEWSEIWSVTKSFSANIIAIESSYKVLSRWYLVPARIAKFTPNYPAFCFRGCTEIGTHVHIWWNCSIATVFWKEIFSLASKMFEIDITPDPVIAILNLKPACLTRKQFKLFLQLLNAAKQTIAKAWKTTTLNLVEVKHRMNNALLHAKMEAMDCDKFSTFISIWDPWIKHGLSPGFEEQVLNAW